MAYVISTCPETKSNRPDTMSFEMLLGSAHRQLVNRVTCAMTSMFSGEQMSGGWDSTHEGRLWPAHAIGHGGFFVGVDSRRNARPS